MHLCMAIPIFEKCMQIYSVLLIANMTRSQFDVLNHVLYICPAMKKILNVLLKVVEISGMKKCKAS
ncbi:hypothetical protein KSF78_0005038 [Schistosoma japonicum]|nr:hypothetical protein KSF78_0005038 [Schistosoma japonicum]